MTLYSAAKQIMLHDRPLIYLYHPITSAGSPSRCRRADVPGHADPGAFAGYK